MLKLPTGESPNSSNTPPNASDLVADLDVRSNDLVIIKRQRGAFLGTDLEEQLRARNIETVVLSGIATNYGVESATPAATGLEFTFVVVASSTTTIDETMQRFAFEKVFPRLGACARHSKSWKP